MNPIDESSFFDAWEGAQRRREEHVLAKRLRITERSQACFSVVQARGVDDGHQMFLDIFRTLDCFGVRRTIQQKEFHAEFANACLPWIYGKEVFARHREDILKRHALPSTSYTQNVLVQCPRRFGKTWCASMWCASLLWHLPHITISVFSTGSRASSSLCNQTYSFLNHLPNAKKRIYKKNEENLFLYGASKQDIRRLFSYPSSVQGLKGVSADIIILEEASRIEKPVLVEVIAPLLLVSYTTLLGISTPEEKSRFTELVRDQVHNQTHFRVVRIELICAACKKEGKEAPCVHANHLQPPWKREDTRMKLVELLMADPEMHERENLGVEGTVSSVFPLDAIARFQNEVYTLQVTPTKGNRIFVAIDPNGGSASRLGVLYASLTHDMTLILMHGGAWNVTSYEDQSQMLPESYRTLLRVYPDVAYLTLCVIVERNFGGVVNSTNICMLMAKEAQNCVCVVDGKQPKPGVVTTAETKERDKCLLTQLLMLDKIRCHASVPQQLRYQIANELRSFTYKVSRNGGHQQLTGKGNGGQNDDLGMCCMLLSSWTSFVTNHPALTCTTLRA